MNQGTRGRPTSSGQNEVSLLYREPPALSKAKFDDLQFLCHSMAIPHTYHAIGKMLGILTKLQKPLNTNALRNLYFTFIHAYLTNGLIVWGSADKKYLDPLIKNQKKAIRIITFSPKNAHTSELFSQLRILPLPSLYNSILEYSILKTPPIIQQLLSKNPNKTNRQKHHFKIPFTH